MERVASVGGFLCASFDFLCGLFLGREEYVLSLFLVQGVCGGKLGFVFWVSKSSD
jgi:hypothetical protein